MAKQERERITAYTVGNSTEVASLTGLTIRRIQQLTQDGTIPTEGKGVYNLSQAVQAYIRFMTSENLTPEEKKIETRRREAETLLKESKARIAHAQAEEIDGKMHRSEDVQAFVSDLVFFVKQELLSLPGRVATDVAISSSAEECSAIIRSVVREVSLELSHYEYDPERYAERVRERMNWSEEEEAPEDE